MEKPPITHLTPKEPKGLILVITGYGKGKTTTAFGLAVRACGHNLRTCIIQFMKGDLYAGEWDGVKKMTCPVELIATGKGFCGIQGNPYPYREHRANAQEAIQLAKEKMASGQVDLLILDEINNALHLKLVDLEQVLELLRLEAAPAAPGAHRPGRPPPGDRTGRHRQRNPGDQTRLPPGHRTPAGHRLLSGRGLDLFYRKVI